MTFAEKCRHYRTALNFTQAQVAALTGISKRTYLYYEQGEKFLPERLKPLRQKSTILIVDFCHLP